jgi:hypothetical protein
MDARRVTLIGLAVFLLLFSGLACSIRGEVDFEGPEPTVASGGEDADEEQTPAAPPTAPPEPTQPPASTEEPTAASGEGGSPPPDLEDPLEAADIPELEVVSLDPMGQGLGNLGTFRQRMTVHLAGQEVTYDGVYHYDAEVNTGDHAVHVTVSAEGDLAGELPANTAQAIWVGSQLWLKVGNTPWLPVPEAVAAPRFEEQILAVGDFLPYAQQFERVGEETVNGIPSAHYTYDAQDLPTEYGTMDARGDIWVALEGGYVVRYTLDGSGTFSAYVQGEATIDLVYDTYDVGADIVIRPPRG